MSCKSIDNMYRDVVQLLVNASNYLTLIRKNNGTKPYKKCRKLLRNQLRQSQYQYKVDYIRNKNDACVIDQKLFWFLVNKRIMTPQSTRDITPVSQ